MSHYKTYPKYKDSGVEWIGEVPEHWGVKPIKFVVSYNDDSLTESESVNTPIRYVDISSVNHEEGISKTEEMLFGNAPSRARRKAKTGDVIISTVRTYLKAVAAIDDNHADCIYSTGFAVLRARPNHIHPSFLKWLALNELFIQAVESHSEGLSYPAINAPVLVGLKSTVPSLPEQTDIAIMLDRETARIDAIIAKKTSFIELLKEKRSALITHAVTKGINPNVKMKDSGVEWIGEVPEHWDVKRFKFAFSSSKNGIWGDDPNGVDDIFCVRVADFDRATLSVCDEIPTLRAVPPKDREGRLLRRGNLLLEKSGGGENQPVGQVVIYSLDKDAICSNFIARMELVQDALPAFWNYSFAAAYDVRLNLRSVKQTSGIQNLDQEQYLSEYAAFPPFDEQAAIATALDRETARIDLLTQKTKHSIDLLKERRSALITAAVTGQIDLREQA